MCGLSGQSGANFGEFTRHLGIVNHGVTDFLADGTTQNLLSVYLSSMNSFLRRLCFPLGELILSLGSFFFILSWMTPTDNDSFFGMRTHP